MDVIEASHFEVVKQWLQDNPGYELKVRSYVYDANRFWEFSIKHASPHVKSPNECHQTALSFGNGLKGLSNLLRKMNTGGSNDSSSAG